ncbi:Hypothetical predicted protein [Podarcis lilfordi]|uniref:Agouti signaling protein n=1 Tax=Podarcis lilfordi TaxID=74358 RepID=A0AA35LMY0_9SAUR|nr:Hypothetical predicted protein [Podarcis lilfordi]
MDWRRHSVQHFLRNIFIILMVSYHLWAAPDGSETAQGESPSTLHFLSPSAGKEPIR